MRFFYLVEITLALVVGSLIYLVATFPNVSELNKLYPVVKYQGKKQAPIVSLSKSRPIYWTKVNEVSRQAIGAIIVSEDWAFYSHGGYDLKQIYESMEKNFKLGKFARGGSTITQQVAKNIYLSNRKTLSRKARELFIAIALEKSLSKRKILELYLNIAEWGEGIFGIANASQFYFHKPPSMLSAKEGAFLAMLLPSPKKYSVSFRQKELTRFARGTINSILQKMVMAQYLDIADLASQIETPLSFELAAQTGSAPEGTENLELDELVTDSESEE